MASVSRAKPGGYEQAETVILIRTFINERSARINGSCGKRGRMQGEAGMLCNEGAAPAQHQTFLALSLGWDNLCANSGLTSGAPSTQSHHLRASCLRSPMLWVPKDRLQLP